MLETGPKIENDQGVTDSLAKIRYAKLSEGDRGTRLGRLEKIANFVEQLKKTYPISLIKEHKLYHVLIGSTSSHAFRTDLPD